MGRRVMRRHIWGYTVCLCLIKRTPGLNELKKKKFNLCISASPWQNLLCWQATLFRSKRIILWIHCSQSFVLCHAMPRCNNHESKRGFIAVQRLSWCCEQKCVAPVRNRSKRLVEIKQLSRCRENFRRANSEQKMPINFPKSALRLESIGHLRMFAANIWHFGTSGFSFVEYLVIGCRYFPNILYLDT